MYYLGDIDKAAIYYYINFLSGKGTGTSFDLTFTVEFVLSYSPSLSSSFLNFVLRCKVTLASPANGSINVSLLQGLTSLAKISKRLQNAIITQEDIFISV